MSSSSSWSHAAECWSSAEEAVRIAEAPVIVSMDTEFRWLIYVMWMTAVYLVLSFSVPLFSFVSGLGLPRLLTWLRSGVRSLDVVESFEMETRLQVQRETLETEQQRRFDEYFVDVENRIAILDSELEAEKQLSKQLQNDITTVKLTHAREYREAHRSMDIEIQILQNRVDNANARNWALEKAMGKLDPPGTGYWETGTGAYTIIAPEVREDSRDDHPQAPPEEPVARPVEPCLLPAEPFSTPAKHLLLPNDPTFVSPQVAGTTPLGDKLMIESIIQTPLPSTLGANLKKSSLPGPNVQPETILEPTRRLHAKKHRARRQGCGMFHKKIPVLDIGTPYVPPGDNAIVKDDHSVQSARRPDGPEHIPTVPCAWNVPPASHATVSGEVEEMVYGAGGSNEPILLPAVSEQFPDKMGSGHLLYPQLDGSSSGQSEGYSDLNSPEVTTKPSGSSYGLDPAHLAVKPNMPTPFMTVRVNKPRVSWMGAVSSPVLERLQDPSPPKQREPDVPGDANPDMSFVSNLTTILQPSILPVDPVEPAMTWALVPFNRTETRPQRLDIDGSRETEGIAQPKVGEFVTTSSTQSSDDFVAEMQVVSLAGTPSIESVDEDMEKHVALQSDTVMIMCPSLEDEIYMKNSEAAEYSMEDEPFRWQPDIETATMIESSGVDITMATETSINADITNQADIPLTMSKEEEGPVIGTSNEMVEENGLYGISNLKDETTNSEAYTGMATEATATFVSAPKDKVIIVETLSNMTEQEPISKTMTPQASCPTAENSTSFDHVAAVMTRQDDASNATVGMIAEYESAQSSEELAVERSPSMDMSAANTVDQRMETLASRPLEPSISGFNLPNLPSDMIISTDKVVEKPEDNRALKSAARPVATPIPFAQRRKIPSPAPKPTANLVKLALQPRLANDAAAIRPLNVIEEQETLTPQLKASRPENSIAASLPGSITKLQPQLGLVRRPKKPVDPFMRKKPARKTHEETSAQSNAQATISKDPLIRKVPADEISTKRRLAQCVHQEAHDLVEDASSKNGQPQEASASKNLVIEDPQTSKDDINNKRVRTSLLPSDSIASTLENKQTCSADQASDAPALFEDRSLEAAQMWTPLQGLTEDQVIKQVSDWLVTDAHFYQKMDECTIMRDFGAFAGFDFEKLLKQCHWTTTWLNEQNKTGNNEMLFEKTQLRRTADYVQKLCAAFLEGKVKNRKNRGKSNGDKIEVVTRINGMEFRGYRALTKEEKRVRDEELDSEKAVDEENIRALMKWAESVLILGRAARKSDKV